MDRYENYGERDDRAQPWQGDYLPFDDGYTYGIAPEDDSRPDIDDNQPEINGIVIDPREREAAKNAEFATWLEAYQARQQAAADQPADTDAAPVVISGTASDAPQEPTDAEPTKPADSTPAEEKADSFAPIETNSEGKFLGFRQVFDGNQPPIPMDEQDRVRDQFIDVVDRVVEEVKTTPVKVDVVLRLEENVVIDGRDVRVSIDAYRAYFDSDRYRFIGIQELQEGVPAGEGSIWQQERDGSVYRWDENFPSWEEQSLFYRNGQPVPVDQYLYDHDSKENRRRQVELGLNNQPIDQDEADTLFEVVDKVMAQWRARIVQEGYV